MHNLKPIVFQAAAAHRSKKVTYNRAGTAFVRVGGRRLSVPKEHQYDLTQATIFGLNERLTMAATSPVVDSSGKTLRDHFNLEWQKYASALAAAKGSYFNYGVYAYYEEKNDLVRFCPPFWHKVVSVASNSKLLADAKQELSWKEIRDIFDNTVVGVVGASVGNSIFHTLVMDMHPNQIKIADKSLYKMENINRVRLRYDDIVEPNTHRSTLTDTLLRNKASVTAEQVYAVDPYIHVHSYSEGLNETNMKRFFKGGGKEPGLDIIVDEVDDPKTKLALREHARRAKIPLLMASDFGSIIQLDITRFDLKPLPTYTFGTSDKKLKDATASVYARPGEKLAFFEFVDALAGKGYRTGELNLILHGKSEIPTSTIFPQLGSTISVAAGIMAETIARIRLGFKHPRRILFNKRDFTVKKYG